MTHYFLDFIFYMFAGVLLGSATLAVLSRNTVKAVFCLIVAIFNGAGLALLLGAEFLAFILMIVYVGAVAVLFLFVVMMIGADEHSKKNGFMKNILTILIAGGVLITEIIIFITGRLTLPFKPGFMTPDATVSNTHKIGEVLYTSYFLPFQLIGVILVVAMIGAIILTQRIRLGVRRQSVKDQITRAPSDTLELKEAPVGEGVKTK